MKRASLEANGSPATQEIPRILWNPEGPLPSSKQPSYLSHINPVYALPSN